jgi:hypothetical protein
MSHYIELCNHCGKVISQCRCMDVNKVKRYGICDECKGLEDMTSEKEGRK